MGRRGVTVFLTVLIVALAGLTGCSLNNVALPAHGYKPIANEVLFSRLRRLPRVERVEGLVWTNGFDNANSYGGQVYVDADAARLEVLDRVVAVLWQGAPGADYGGVTVSGPSGARISPWDVMGLSCPTDLLARYGPQPGTGKVPPNAPKLRLRKPGDPIGCPPESTSPTPR